MTDRMNTENLENVAGGNGAPGQNLHVAQPHVDSGYLAVRHAISHRTAPQ